MARSVLLEYAEHGGNGTFLFIENDTRHVSIQNGELDPNRMFTDHGLEANLKTLNPEWNHEKVVSVIKKISTDREAFVQTLFPPPDIPLIALHNNQDGYSIHDETEGATDLYIADESQPHDFVICNDRRDFEYLQTSPYNAVLQETVTRDDGALSVLATHRGVRYMNIEVELKKENQALQRSILHFILNNPNRGQRPNVCQRLTE